MIAADIRDAQRLVKFRSRAEFKSLPLEMVLVPALDAPVLVHESPPRFVDVDGFTCLALPMLIEQRKAYPRVYDGAKRAQFARLLRNLWCQMVDQADYYTWPDATHYGVPALYVFAPDA